MSEKKIRKKLKKIKIQDRIKQKNNLEKHTANKIIQTQHNTDLSEMS